MPSPGTANAIEYTLVLTCITLSAWQLSLILEDFFSGATTTRVGQEKLPEMVLPHITICPKYGYKEQMDFFVEEQDFLKNTFSEEEIIKEQETWSSTWNIEERRLLFRGRCYTLSYPDPVGTHDLRAAVVLDRGLTYSVILHDPGQEIFLSAGLDPMEVVQVDNVLEDENVHFADIHIKKSVVKELRDCADISLEEYLTCVTKNVESVAERTCYNIFHDSLLGGSTSASR